jgi:hypothetical protein
MARRLEKGCEKQSGWMDLPPSKPVTYSVQPTAPLHTAEPGPAIGPLDWRTAAMMLVRQCKDATQRELLIEFVREVDQVVAESAQISPVRAKFVTP